MKQLDFILCGVALVVGIVGSMIVWSTKKPPEFAPAVKTIDTTPVQLPPPNIIMDTKLPGAQGGAMGRGGKRAGGFVG